VISAKSAMFHKSRQNKFQNLYMSCS